MERFTVRRPDELHGHRFDLDLRSAPALYLAVALEAGAVIALQICIMRIFQVGSWAHFGSLVVSLAMLGFGLTSAVMCIRKDWFERHWQGVATTSLFLFGPLTVAANLIAQQIPFNAIFLISDPMQKWRLAGNFLLYMLPFLAGAFFLGTVFLKAKNIFGRVYFADLCGAGTLRSCGPAGDVRLVAGEPDRCAAAFMVRRQHVLVLGHRRPARRAIARRCGDHLDCGAFRAASLARCSKARGLRLQGGVVRTKISRQRARLRARVAVRISGDLFQLLPALRPRPLRQCGIQLPKMPVNAYLGMYVDGDGPSGIIRELPAEETAYYRFLPMFFPYLIKAAPDTFVVQFGGGISTSVALKNSNSVTVAEANPSVLDAFRTDQRLRAFTGDILNDPRVRVVDYDGRLFLAHGAQRYDVIDLSLANSTGLSSPGGFAIVEKYSYTREAMTSYMRALRDGGVLSVTLWNKEEPPKSVLKLYATMAAAARAVDNRRDRRPLLRGRDLPLDRDRALQARRLHCRRDRQAARAHARHVIRRDLLSRLRVRPVANREGAGGLPAADLLRRRERYRAAGRAQSGTGPVRSGRAGRRGPRAG